jgi:hypothetical protein
MSVENLLPTSKLSQKDKYTLAWETLKPSYSDDARAHAKCWLTYRCFDGEVTYADWIQHVRDIKLNPSSRWVGSLHFAFGLCLFRQGNLVDAISCFEQCRSLIQTPECTLNALRSACILCKYHLLSGDKIAATHVIFDTLHKWQMLIAGFNFLKHPQWIIDGGGDSLPIHLLLRSAGHAGLTKFDIQHWILEQESHQNHLPWKRCYDELVNPIDIGKAWIVVCRHSDEFNLSQAANIKKQFEKFVTRTDWRFICLTDKPSENWHLPLKSEKMGWWSIMESFQFKGPHILTGLDSIIMGDVSPLLDLAEACPKDTLYGIRDFYQPHEWASGVTIWNGNWRKLDEICTEKQMKSHRGNQEFTRYAVKTGLIFNRKLNFIQDKIDGIISYKRDVRDAGLKNPPEGTRICCFHGKPRPWEIKADWIPTT